MINDNANRNRIALLVRAAILARIQQSSGLSLYALSAEFSASKSSVSNHCNHLAAEKLVKKFTYPRTGKEITPCIWLPIGFDTSLIVLPIQPPPKPRVLYPRFASTPKRARTESRLVMQGAARQIGCARDALVEAFFGPATKHVQEAP